MVIRITKERQDARIRVSKIKVAICESWDSVPDADETDVLMALTELSQDLQNQIFLKKYPLEQT